MGFLEVFELQFNATRRAGDGLAGRGRQHLLLLHHASTNVIEVPPGMLFVQRIRNKGQDHTVAQCTSPQAFSQILAILAILLVCLSWNVIPGAACTVEREPPGDSKLFLRHASRDCSQPERVRHAVEAAQILGALKAGKGVSLNNMMITGDLLLTNLAAVPVATVSLPEQILSKLIDSRIALVRIIRGPLLIQNSTVDGVIDTQRAPEMSEHRVLGDKLVIEGPVSFKGTTFAKEVDLSHTVFLEAVDSSEAVYLGDAFFLSGVFHKPVTFEKTAFSANARFYQAIFYEPVTFLRAGFNGLTNFLSVTFHKEASFSRSYFKMGVGFTGSRFEGISDFSEAVFEKSVFFIHTVFVSDTYFRRATFRGEVDFSDAVFHGKDDFAKVFYQHEPNFTRTTFTTARSSVGFDNPIFLGIVGVTLGLFLIAFIIMLRKG